ncbi:MAG: nuclear transport factor 2 family protein [Nitrospinae bacterium]|nr:nuclear transport factor 2 family protein [Nitrospinota bacterium]
MDQAIKDEVWATIQYMNRLWTVENRPEELANYFHEKMVAITATDKLRVEGRAACVAGWKGFVEAAKIHYWKEIDPKVEFFGDGIFAIVTYYFDMSFDMGGATINMSGRDMFALVKEDGKWWVVADQFSPMPH